MVNSSIGGILVLNLVWHSCIKNCKSDFSQLYTPGSSYNKLSGCSVFKALRSYNQCIAPARRARAGRKSRIRNFTHALDRRSAVELPRWLSICHSAPGPRRIRRVYGVSRSGQIETSMAMDAYLLSFSANSLGAQRTNNKSGRYVLMCNTNICILNLVS